MIYNHFSELPIDAFKPSFGSMKLYGGGNPVSDVVNSVSDAVSNVGDSISNTVSNAAQDIGSVGNQIDQSVNSAVPGGWATVGAAALAAVTMGGSLAADGAVGAADAAATAAPAELDATGTLAATAADTGAGGAGALAGTDAGLSAIPTATDTGLSMVPPEEIAPTPTGSELDPTGSLAQQANPSYLQQLQNAYSTLPGYAQGALLGAGKGMAVNAVANTLAGKPITAQGLLQAGLAGGVGGGLADVTGSNFIGGLGALGTNALLSKSLSPTTMASAIPSLMSSLSQTSTPSTSSGVSPTTTGTSPNNVTDNTTAPKGKFFQGQQIASPFANITPVPVPVDNTTTANYDPAKLQEIQNQLQLQQIQNAKTGGIIHKAAGGDLQMISQQLRGSQTQHANPFIARGVPLYSLPKLADGGSLSMEDRTLPEGHNPQFFSEGGLNSLKNRYVTGAGDGTSDSIPAMLANGEFVIPADVVSNLGNGSNDSGAEILNEFLSVIREHKQKHDAKHLPPDSKGALAYLLQANKKVRA